jgi:hypothetical protein
MTAPTKLSVPEKTARAIEALGWTVERQRDGDKRVLVCTRGDDVVKLRWDRNERNRDVFTRGVWIGVDSIESVSEAFKMLAEQNGASLAHLDDETLLATLEGKTVVWRNRISGQLDESYVGKMIEVTMRPNGRSIGFTSPEGFRAVYLAQIESVR